MSTTKAAPQINRKQTRAEVDGQIQKSIPMYLQAAPWQRFEKMFGKHTPIQSRALRRGDVSLRDDPVTGNERLFLKVGSSRAYQDYGQGQGEHPVQPGATRLNIFFAKKKPSEAERHHSKLEKALCFFAGTVVFILETLTPCSIRFEVLIVVSSFVVALIMGILTKIQKRQPEIRLLSAGYPMGDYNKTLSSAEASLCCGEAGEKEKESMRGMMEREKRGLCRMIDLFV